MISLEEVLANNEIKFPKAISKRSFESLLYFLSTKLEADIHCTIENKQSLMYISPGKSEHTYKGVKYHGVISPKDHPCAASFESGDKDNPGQISYIKFVTVQHNLGEVEIWRKTKRFVESYFSREY